MVKFRAGSARRFEKVHTQSIYYIITLLIYTQRLLKIDTGCMGGGTYEYS